MPLDLKGLDENAFANMSNKLDTSALPATFTEGSANIRSTQQKKNIVLGQPYTSANLSTGYDMLRKLKAENRDILASVSDISKYSSDVITLASNQETKLDSFTTGYAKLSDTDKVEFLNLLSEVDTTRQAANLQTTAKAVVNTNLASGNVKGVTSTIDTYRSVSGKLMEQSKKKMDVADAKYYYVRQLGYNEKKEAVDATVRYQKLQDRLVEFKGYTKAQERNLARSGFSGSQVKSTNALRDESEKVGDIVGKYVNPLSIAGVVAGVATAPATVPIGAAFAAYSAGEVATVAAIDAVEKTKLPTTAKLFLGLGTGILAGAVAPSTVISKISKGVAKKGLALTVAKGNKELLATAEQTSLAQSAIDSARLARASVLEDNIKDATADGIFKALENTIPTSVMNNMPERMAKEAMAYNTELTAAQELISSMVSPIKGTLATELDFQILSSPAPAVLNTGKNLVGHGEAHAKAVSEMYNSIIEAFPEATFNPALVAQTPEEAIAQAWNTGKVALATDLEEQRLLGNFLTRDDVSKHMTSKLLIEKELQYEIDLEEAKKTGDMTKVFSHINEYSDDLLHKVDNIIDETVDNPAFLTHMSVKHPWNILKGWVVSPFKGETKRLMQKVPSELEDLGRNIAYKMQQAHEVLLSDLSKSEKKKLYKLLDVVRDTNISDDALRAQLQGANFSNKIIDHYFTKMKQFQKMQYKLYDNVAVKNAKEAGLVQYGANDFVRVAISKKDPNKIIATFADKAKTVELDLKNSTTIDGKTILEDTEGLLNYNYTSYIKPIQNYVPVESKGSFDVFLINPATGSEMLMLRGNKRAARIALKDANSKLEGLTHKGLPSEWKAVITARGVKPHASSEYLSTLKEDVTKGADIIAKKEAEFIRNQKQVFGKYVQDAIDLGLSKEEFRSFMKNIRSDRDMGKQYSLGLGKHALERVGRDIADDYLAYEDAMKSYSLMLGKKYSVDRFNSKLIDIFKRKYADMIVDGDWSAPLLIKNGTNVKSAANAKFIQQQIKNNYNMVSPEVTWLDKQLLNLQERMDKGVNTLPFATKFANKANDGLNILLDYVNIGASTRAAKQFGTISKLSLAPVQVFLQASNTAIGFFMFPLEGLGGMMDMQKLVGVKMGKRFALLDNFVPREWKQLAAEINITGATANTRPADFGIGDFGRWSKINSAIMSPVQLGEDINRTYATVIANRVAKKKGFLVGSQEHINFTNQLAKELSLDMTHFSQTRMSQGVLGATIGQFKRYLTQTTSLLFTSDMVTTRQKVQALLGLYGLYGKEGIPLVGDTKEFYNSLVQPHLMGLPAMLTHNIAEGIKNNEFITHLRDRVNSAELSTEQKNELAGIFTEEPDADVKALWETHDNEDIVSSIVGDGVEPDENKAVSFGDIYNALTTYKGVSIFKDNRSRIAIMSPIYDMYDHGFLPSLGVAVNSTLEAGNNLIQLATDLQLGHMNTKVAVSRAGERLLKTINLGGYNILQASKMFANRVDAIDTISNDDIEATKLNVGTLFDFNYKVAGEVRDIKGKLIKDSSTFSDITMVATGFGLVEEKEMMREMYRADATLSHFKTMNKHIAQYMNEALVKDPVGGMDTFIAYETAYHAFLQEQFADSPQVMAAIMKDFRSNVSANSIYYLTVRQRFIQDSFKKGKESIELENAIQAEATNNQ